MGVYARAKKAGRILKRGDSKPSFMKYIVQNSSVVIVKLNFNCSVFCQSMKKKLTVFLFIL